MEDSLLSIDRGPLLAGVGGRVFGVLFFSCCMVLASPHDSILGQEQGMDPITEPLGEDALATLKSGIIDFASGSRYEGDLREGKMDGRGTFYYVNGDTYAGQFSDGQMHGIGELSFSNGDRYEGAFVSGKR